MTDEALLKELEDISQDLAALSAEIHKLSTIRNRMQNRVARLKREVKKRTNNTKQKQEAQDPDQLKLTLTQ